MTTASVTLSNPVLEAKPSLPDHFLSADLKAVIHHRQAGVNPLVDAAASLFSMMGKLKQLAQYRHLGQLQQELTQAVTVFLAAIHQQGYNAEYTIVAHYMLCGTIDDVIINTAWGEQAWDGHRMLVTVDQENNHHDQLFTIIERAINDPGRYIDLMELIYICLSFGYRGRYRGTTAESAELEQMTNHLYKHIQAYRGPFTRTLSQTPTPIVRAVRRKSPVSHLLAIWLMAACVILALFVGLSYLTDVYSHAVYQNIAHIEARAHNDAFSRA